MIKLSASEENFFNDVIYETLQLHDYDLQCFVACEELAELIQAISKTQRLGSPDAENFFVDYCKFIEEQLIGEIADVYIMLAQLLQIFNISDRQIKEKIIKKLERQAERNKKKEELKNV